MGLFDFFKKGKKEDKAEVKSNNRKQNSFITNITDFGFEDFELGIAGKVRVDGILAIAEMQKRAKRMNVEFSYAVLYVSLLEEGALTVPIVINFGDKAYTLYFIYNEEDLLKYKDLQKHVGKTAYPNLIYFSSIPIYEGYEPKEIIEPFQLADMRFEKKPKLKGTYAMWWSDHGVEKYGNSETYNLLSRLYEVYKGYETYLLGYLLRQTRITEELELQRMILPETTEKFAVIGPENKLIVLSVSQEKGIRFLFPITSTSKEYRERFLKGVLVDFLSTRLYLEENDLEKDEAKEINSYDWFTFMSKITVDKENKGEKIEVIGGIEF